MALWLWIGGPLVVIHLALWRWWRPALCFQLLVDLCLAAVIGPALVTGADLNPARCLQGTAPYDEWHWSELTASQPTQSDLVLQFHPWWAEVRRKLRAGEPPWISERIGAGLPLLANGQSGLLAPVMLPVWALGPERGTTVMAAWKLEAAALGAFLLLWRCWRMRWQAAAITGLAAGCSTFQVAWLLVPLGWVVAALPWLWWATVAALRRRRRLWASVAAGLAMGWLLGSGLHPETTVIVLGATWLMGLVQAPRRWRRVLLMAAVALPLALALSWPTLAYIGASAKAHELARRQPNLTPVPLPVRVLAAEQLLVPAAHGHPGHQQWRAPYPYAAAATGIGGAALVLLAAGRIRRRYRGLALAALICLASAAVLAYRVPPLDWVLVRVPPLDRMTLTRFACLVPWGLAVLAGLGADGLLHRRPRSWVAPWGMVLALGGAALAAGVWTLRPINLVLVLVTLGSGLASTLLLRRVGAVACVVAVELAVLAWGVNPLCDPADRLPRPELIRRLVEQVMTEPGRAIGIGSVLPPNMASRYGLADLRAFDPLRPLPMTRLLGALGEPEPVLGGALEAAPAGLCGAWGVRYLVAPAAVDAKGWTRLWSDAATSLWRNPRVLPEVRLCGEVIRAEEARATELLLGDTLDLGRVTVVPPETPVIAADAMMLDVLDDRPHRLELECACSGPCLVAVARPWAPGWQAEIDGVRVGLVRTNLAGLGVVVPSQRHRVVLAYSPWSW